MGNIYSSFTTCDFDSILNKINSPTTNIIINTLPDNLQNCLIKSTIAASIESNVINDLLKKRKLLFMVKIIEI